MIEILITISIVGVSGLIGFFVGYGKLDEKLLNYWRSRNESN